MPQGCRLESGGPASALRRFERARVSGQGGVVGVTALISKVGGGGDGPQTSQAWVWHWGDRRQPWVGVAARLVNCMNVVVWDNGEWRQTLRDEAPFSSASRMGSWSGPMFGPGGADLKEYEWKAWWPGGHLFISGMMRLWLKRKSTLLLPGEKWMNS